MSISRRTLLIASAVTATTAGALGIFKLYTGKREDVVVAILERQLGYLNIDKQSFATFAVDYVDNKRESRNQLKILSILADPLEYVSPHRFLSIANPYRRMEDSVVSLFLLSTDFFTNGAVAEKQVSYLGFYDPLLAACRNPIMQQIST